MNKNSFKKISLLFIGFVFLSSCLKKVNLDEQDLGPAISSDELQSKMGDSIGVLNYSDINKNEISVLTASTIFEETQVNKRYKQDLFVTKLTDTDASLTVDFLFNKQDYINTDRSFTNQPYQMVIERNPANNASINGLSVQANINSKDARNVQAQAETPIPFFLYRAYVYFAIQGCREDKVTCHNLKETNSKMFIKSSLASPKVCPDINSCIIDVKKIEFDMLDRSISTTDGKPYRTHYSFEVSPQLPFLSKVLDYCVRGLTDYNGRKVLAEDCVSINDFSYGQEP